MSKYRNRLAYAANILLVIALGLGSRRFSRLLPEWLSIYSGDVLWGLMVFLMTGFILRKKPPLGTGIIAMVAAALVELSQLYHAPWIDSIRSTTLGGLVLGYGFLWSDLVCYAAGIAFGVLVEIFVAAGKKV